MANENGTTEEASPGEDLVNADDSGTMQDDVDELRKTIKELEAQQQDLRDQYLRKQADFDNYRKRTTKEKTDSIAYANADLISSMLDILDNFERAQLAAEQGQDIKAIQDGIAMIQFSLTQLLGSKGLIRMTSVGELFNPDIHQAIATEESADVQQPTVVEEYQCGYKLHDRVLRSARVKVQTPKASTDVVS